MRSEFVQACRRAALSIASAAAIAAFWPVAEAGAQVAAPIPLGSQRVLISPVVQGLNDTLVGNVANARPQLIPIDMTPLGDGRQLILTLTGHVRLLGADGTLSGGAYLDTFNANSPPPFGRGRESDFKEIGNTSIAAHPGFLDPASRGYGKFYTATTELPDSGAGGIGNNADFFDGRSSSVDSVVTEWSVAPSAISSATRLTPGGPGANVTSREVLRSQRPGIIHTVADLAFTKDEYLLVTSGDGGGNAFPNTDGSAFGADRFTNAQDPSNVFGTVLRIDPLSRPGDTRPVGGRFGQYRVAPDNFGAADGDPDTLAEAFAYGVRSPYRISVDRGTGDIYLGDVGEERVEEVNRIVNGGNYGWGAYEGTFTVRGELVPGPGETPATGPLWQLFHDVQGPRGTITEANNVVGGFVYRGSDLPDLLGKYVFADTGESDDGEPTNLVDLYYGDLDEVTPGARTGLQRLRIELPEGVSMPDRIWSMAEGEDGELYLLVGPSRQDLFEITGPGETDGGVWQITAVPEPTTAALAGLLSLTALRRLRRRRACPATKQRTGR